MAEKNTAVDFRKANMGTKQLPLRLHTAEALRPILRKSFKVLKLRLHVSKN